MTTTNQPMTHIRINRTITSTGKRAYDATVTIEMPTVLSGDGEDVSALAISKLRDEALLQSDMLVAELERWINGAEAPAAVAG
ncbi:MAG: hypothetical protein IIC97_03485, partial [Chloroflexi bacterium]|nr:hypothetical protein [Chloroflexota bacterium]